MTHEERLAAHAKRIQAELNRQRPNRSRKLRLPVPRTYRKGVAVVSTWGERVPGGAPELARLCGVTYKHIWESIKHQRPFQGRVWKYETAKEKQHESDRSTVAASSSGEDRHHTRRGSKDARNTTCNAS